MTSKSLVAGLLAALCILAAPTFASADQTGMAGMHEWRKERGKTCFVDHFHSGSSGVQSTKKAAMRAAIESWFQYTAGEYGTDWARFNRSASRSQRCSKAGDGWECFVESRPCL